MKGAPDTPATERRIAAVQVVLPCTDLKATIRFFVERLGFRLERIAPADDPAEAELTGHGQRILMRKGGEGPPGVLRLLSEESSQAEQEALVAPNGTRIEFAPIEAELEVPGGKQELVVSRAGDDSGWVTGRAGMRYRDLIPGRLGGRFVASHIRIAEGGTVPDSVHFHAVRFQLIYCAKGWVKVAYQDQGPPFVLNSGDAVLQPPRIRHRVLESSEGLEVLEVTCPAQHDTLFDHDLELPAVHADIGRTYTGQRFVRHVASAATWKPGRSEVFEARDTGIEEATAGLASVQVLRATGAVSDTPIWRHEGELCLLIVLQGELTLVGARPDSLRLDAGDSVTIPAGLDCAPKATSARLELLEVRL